MRSVRLFNRLATGSVLLVIAPAGWPGTSISRMPPPPAFALLTPPAASPPRTLPPSKTALTRAIDTLTKEAVASKESQRLSIAEPDFAKRFAEAVDERALLNALLKPANPDPFIDAYVRWQLTSLARDLPALDDRQFAKLMAAAPPLLECPKAAPTLVSLLEKAEQAGRLSERDRQRLQEAWTKALQQVQIVESLNRPALGFRAWVEKQLPAEGPRLLQWMIERIASTIQSGRSVRDAKGDLTRAVRIAGTTANSSALTPAHRAIVAEQIERLSGLRRRAVDDVTFMGDGRVEVTFSNAYVDEGDVKKWIALLNGEETD